jgi:hypothetical protein
MQATQAQKNCKKGTQPICKYVLKDNSVILLTLNSESALS